MDENEVLKEKEEEREGGLGGFASRVFLVEGLRWMSRGWRRGGCRG